MTVTIKYLASLAEELGKTQESVELAPQHRMTVQMLWDKLNPDNKIKNNTICAINFQYARLDDEVTDGVELAFFPPVTGG